MRVANGMMLVAAAALAGGCSPNEGEVKNELRAQMMSRCIGDIAPKAKGVEGFDPQRFCTCVTDRAIGERSVADLKAMFEDKTGTAAEGRKAGSECLAQQLPGPSGVPITLPEEKGPAAADDAAPAKGKGNGSAGRTS